MRKIDRGAEASVFTEASLKCHMTFIFCPSSLSHPALRLSVTSFSPGHDLEHVVVIQIADDELDLFVGLEFPPECRRKK